MDTKSIPLALEPVKTEGHMATEKQPQKLIGTFLEHMHFFKELATEDAQWAIQNPKEAIEVIITAIADRTKEVTKGIFTSFSTFNLEAVSEHNTKDCFQNGERIKYWRDSDLDTWTPPERKAHQGGAYIAESLTERADFREMAASVLGIDLEAEEVSNKVLQKQLITAGHCVEMKQIEREIERVEAGEKTSLAKDGNFTFFFIENYDGSVSVVRVYWYSNNSRWNVSVYRFDDDVRWGPGARVVSRNSSELSS